MSKLKIFKRLTLISGGVGGLCGAIYFSYKEQEQKKEIYQKIPYAMYGLSYGFTFGVAVGISTYFISPVWVPVILYDKLIKYKNN